MAKVTATYIVIHSQGQWWIDLDGKVTGPFSNADIAVESALWAAQSAASVGRRSEVRVNGPGYPNKLVYQSELKSALSRARNKMTET